MPARAYCEIDFPHPSQPGRLRAAFAEPELILTAATAEQVPELLSRAEERARAGCWVIGFVAYEAARAFDPALRTRPKPPGDMAYAQFAVFRGTVAARARADHLCGAWRDATPPERFDAAIAHIRNGIAAGDYYQVNYTTRLGAPFSGDGLSWFDKLRASQPEAYCAYLDFSPWQVCSVSPELFFHWGMAASGERTLTCRPMKGTARRHEDAVLDRAAARALMESPKERAENLMIVDLMRNDLSRVARPGSVKARPLFSIEPWPTVWQMTSTVSCNTIAGTGLREVFRALFPCGSVTGAPKAAAMQAIGKLEAEARGVYCGAIGLLLPGGEAVFSVGIRTPVINAIEGRAECGIGSGITHDSSPAQEQAEWRVKQAFLQLACPPYQLLETLRLHQGRYWLLRGHLERLARSAHAIGFEFDAARVTAALRLHAQQHPLGNWRARLLLEPDGEVTVEILPLDALPAVARAALAKAPVMSGSPHLRHKTTQREIYAALANGQTEVFDILLYNERGELTEFTRGNLVVELEGRLLTPAAGCGLLPGVYRDLLLRHGRIREGIVRRDDLARANRIWFINSVRGAVPVLL